MNLSLQRTEFTKVSNVIVPDTFYRRIMTGISEIDEMFGNGILPGSAITITARAGCGKTTFLLQIFETLAKNGYSVAYASGEENLHQLAFNCKRLNVTNVNVANETDIDKLVQVTKDYDILAIDSFQALSSTEDLNKRELEAKAVNSLVTAAKENECTIFFVMHLTKAGVLKGSTLIPHTVDVNMRIDYDPEANDETARIISFEKNRYGPCIEVNSVMTEKGFYFTGVRENVEKADNKKNRNLNHQLSVLAMVGDITKQRVIKELQITPAQAYVLLKNMCDMGQLKKIGRGDDAYFVIENNE